LRRATTVAHESTTFGGELGERFTLFDLFSRAIGAATG